MSELLGTGLTNEITRRALLNSIKARVAVEAERDAALATIERVRALHAVDDYDCDTQWCRECGYSWPCATVRAIEVTS